MADTSISHHDDEDDDLRFEPHSTPKVVFSKPHSELTPATAATAESTTNSSMWEEEEEEEELRRISIPKAMRPPIDPMYAKRLPESLGAGTSSSLMPPPTVQRNLFTQKKAGQQQQLSPSRLPPASKRAKFHGDRYIPSRLDAHYSSLDTSLWKGIAKQAEEKESTETSDEPMNSETSENAMDRSSVFASPVHRNTLCSLLATEVLQRDENELPRLRFSTSIPQVSPNAIVHALGLSPVSPASQKLVAVPSKRKRKIPKVPFKVLDAPALQDDFYLNLVDWSSQNVLAVGLGACVYLWSACTSKVTKLCDLTADEDTITAVSWAARGVHLSVGTNKGEVQLWDTVRCKKVRSMGGHAARVGTLAWSGALLASGSRDRLIYLRDVRVQEPFTQKLSNHRQEVCGLKWSYEEPAFLASGGNDNNLHVIDSRNPVEPLHKFADHTAAVKAIAWSPHQHGLLASGGGTADRCIRFWNTLSGASLNKIDTGSQVCNLAWSQNCNEIVSTHGYSLNQIVVWRYPSMTKVTTLTGHTYRVLYLAMSPDGSTVVTGAGDETLRFWQVFPGPRSNAKNGSNSLLFPQTLGSIIR